MFVIKAKESGFTMVEIVVVLIVVSILVAVAIPNLLGLYNYYRAKEAFIQLKSSINEAQRQAMRRGKTCKIKLDEVTVKGSTKDRITVVSSLDPGERGKDYTNCLTSDRILPESINLETNIPGRTNKITFSHKGNTITSGTIRLSNTIGNFDRCLVISNGLGIMRTGSYDKNISGRMAKKCKSKN